MKNPSMMGPTVMELFSFCQVVRIRGGLQSMAMPRLCLVPVLTQAQHRDDECSYEICRSWRWQRAWKPPVRIDGEVLPWGAEDNATIVPSLRAIIECCQMYSGQTLGQVVKIRPRVSVHGLLPGSAPATWRAHPQPCRCAAPLAPSTHPLPHHLQRCLQRAPRPR